MKNLTSKEELAKRDMSKKKDNNVSKIKDEPLKAEVKEDPKLKKGNTINNFNKNKQNPNDSNNLKKINLK